MLVITEAGSARQVKSIPVSCTERSIMLKAGSLPVGTYLYTLFVDGKAIDSKSMVIGK